MIIKKMKHKELVGRYHEMFKIETIVSDGNNLVQDFMRRKILHTITSDGCVPPPIPDERLIKMISVGNKTVITEKFHCVSKQISCFSSYDIIFKVLSIAY